jgi:hypothetical protein
MQEWAIRDGEGNIVAVCATATRACFVWPAASQPGHNNARCCVLSCVTLLMQYIVISMCSTPCKSQVNVCRAL